MEFTLPCKVLILIGIAMMTLLTVFFVLLLKKQSILLKFFGIVISILKKFNLQSVADKFKLRVDNMMERYKECVETVYGKKRLLAKTYLLNLLQRASQILVTVFCYYATGGNIFKGIKVFAIQTYVVIGSNFIPIPGAIGISEFLMYFGYAEMVGPDAACSLAILSRGISFYTCSIISIFTVILGFILVQQKKNKEKAL